MWFIGLTKKGKENNLELDRALLKQWEIQQLNTLGKGFYAQTFYAKGPDQDYCMKIHNDELMAEKEFAQLTVLSQHCGWVRRPLQREGRLLVLPFVPGVCMDQPDLTNTNAQALCGQVATALVELHRILPSVEVDWQQEYLSWIDKLKFELSTQTPDWVHQQLTISTKTLEHFFIPVKDDQASLIHGDINVWNILIDPKSHQLTGFIDPFESGFFHRELDLIHLDCARKDLELLKTYQDLFPLTQGWRERMAIYGFCNDIYHHLLTGWWNEDYLRGRQRVILELTG